jgi:hypothetical protein
MSFPPFFCENPWQSNVETNCLRDIYCHFVCVDESERRLSVAYVHGGLMTMQQQLTMH